MKLLIADVDNTLFDWLGYWVPGLRAARDLVAAEVDVPPKDVARAFRNVYRRHGTVEYGNAAQELVLNGKPIPPDIASRALAIQRTVSHEHLVPYEGVGNTLEQLRRRGVEIVAVTNSPRRAAEARLNHLGLFTCLSAIAARDRAAPPGSDPTLQPMNGGLQGKRTLAVTAGKQETMARICAEFSCAPQDALAIGDSWERDLQPALRAGIPVAWAKYGAQTDLSLFADLLTVTPWDVPDDFEEPTPPSHVPSLTAFGDVARLADIQPLELGLSASKW